MFSANQESTALELVLVLAVVVRRLEGGKCNYCSLLIKPTMLLEEVVASSKLRGVIRGQL